MDLIHIGIIIPIYKSDLSDIEKISITRAFKIFKKYRIIFVAPQSLNVINYKEYFELCNYQFQLISLLSKIVFCQVSPLSVEA